MTQVRIDVSDFRGFGRSLSRAARDVSDEVRQSLREAGEDVGPKMRDAGAAAMPRSGGLSALVGQAVVVVKDHAGFGEDAEVEVGLASSVNLRNLDRGVVYHPVFGDRGVWVSQSVPSGHFSQAAREKGPQVIRDKVGDAVGRVIRSAARF